MSLNDLLTEEDLIQTGETLGRPKVLTKTVAKRHLISGLKRQAISKLIPTLPPPDTDLYVIGNGAGTRAIMAEQDEAFDLGTFLYHLVDLLGGDGIQAHISTWSMNPNHAHGLIDLLDTGGFQSLVVMSDPYFPRVKPEAANILILGMQKHKQPFITFKNHLKAICLKAPDDRTVSITGSANLSWQPRTENYNLTTSPDVYDFYIREYFNVMLDKKRGK